MDNYPDTEELSSSLDKNNTLFENKRWEINDSNRKKELPPLKETVSIYRKENPKKQKELYEKWHANENSTTNQFESDDSKTNFFNKEESETISNKSTPNNFFENNNFADEDDASYSNDLTDNKITNKDNRTTVKVIDETPASDRTSRRITFSVDEEIRPDSQSSLKRDLFAASNPDIGSSNADKTNNYINNNNHYNNEESSKTDYRKLALDLASQHSSKGKEKDKRESLPDFVLVYNVHDADALHKKERELFEAKIQEEDIAIVYDIVDNNMFVQLYPTFERLCQEAEAVALEMPLEGVCIFS